MVLGIARMVTFADPAMFIIFELKKGLHSISATLFCIPDIVLESAER